MMLKVLLPIVICFIVTEANAQPLVKVDSYIKAVDRQNNNVKRDTSHAYLWNASTGNATDTIVTAFKLSSDSKNLIRAVVYRKGKEQIAYYYRNGKLLAAKIDFSKEFSSWNGKTIFTSQVESNNDNIQITNLEDESEDNVVKTVTYSGYAWLRYFEKARKSNRL